MILMLQIKDEGGGQTSDDVWSIKHIFYWFRSGVLQTGDRILAINGQMLEGMTLEDARSIIKKSNHQIHLEI